MKRTTLILGVVAVMAAMIVNLAAPAMAKDNEGNVKNNGNGNNNRQHNNNNGNNGGGNNHFDNRLDRIDNRVNNWFDNRHDNWFDNDQENINIRYVADSDDFDSFYPYWGYYPYWGSYGDCGFDWDGPVTPVDC
jgi:hypothetical protein